ncbi:MAG: hypothetical protein INQ03_12725 [Candidatus Heimdallarchaeota archaeon]|nr:hypothetical protein [Candidatus Heimdallarchaeota archaeon]
MRINCIPDGGNKGCKIYVLLLILIFLSNPYLPLLDNKQDEKPLEIQEIKVETAKIRYSTNTQINQPINDEIRVVQSNPPLKNAILLDIKPPVVATSPGDQQFSIYNADPTISWFITDNNPKNITVYVNGSMIYENLSPLNNQPVDLVLSGYSTGVYNFTLFVWDNDLEFAVDTVYITFYEGIEFVYRPADIILEYGSTTAIDWNTSYILPDKYEIFLDSVSIQSGVWTTANNITITTGSLTLGQHTYRVDVNGTDGELESDTVQVTVQDTTAPTLVSSPSDITCYADSIDIILAWNVSDLLANTYEIYQDDVLINSGTWINYENVTETVNSSLTLGVYKFTIIAFDTSLNTVSHDVWITITEPIPPSVNYFSNQTYEEDSTGNYLTFMGNDSNPDYYKLYLDSVLVNTSAWISLENITINVDGLLPGEYNYTLVLYDTVGNFNSTTIYLIVLDTKIPVLNSGSGNLTYEDGQTGNTLTWNASDKHPVNYQIYRNGSLKVDSIWVSGSRIQYNADERVGIYNYTILFIDESGNILKVTSIITVEDTTQPVITSSPTLINGTIIEEGTSGTLVWVATDLNPYLYTIYKNEVEVSTQLWTSGGNIIISISDLDIGVYNYTIIIWDDSFNYVINYVTFQIKDTIAPILITQPLSYNETSIEFGDTGNMLIWNATDNNPNIYYIYKNNVVISSQIWISNGPIQISIDGLSTGSYNYTLLIKDKSNNYVTSTILFSIVDSLIPVFTTEPIAYNNTILEEGSTGHTLVWVSTDLLPYLYSIYRNNVSITTQIWSSGGNIQISIDGLDIGIFNYTIIVWDQSLNYQISYIQFSVEDSIIPTLTLQPTSVNNTDVEQGSSTSLTWKAYDRNPFTYVIYKNGAFLSSNFWTSSSTIEISLATLKLGSYNYTIVFSDTSQNSNKSVIIIEIVDTTVPNFISQPADISYSVGTNGHTLSWQANDTNPSSYLIKRNDVTIVSGDWNGLIQIITISIDGLSVGEYNFTIQVSDTSGNVFEDQVTVIVGDYPVFTTSPGNATYLIDTSIDDIIWVASDSNPDKYIIFRTNETGDEIETQVQSGSWSNGLNIAIDVNGLDLGIYNFTILVNDTNGNTIYSTMFVIVTDIPSWDDIPNDITDYIEGNTGYTLSWNATDQFPDYYILYLDGEEFKIGNWNNSDYITINIDGLLKGTYNFTLKIVDKYDNYNTDFVEVIVLDETDPEFTLSPTDSSYYEGTEGNTIEFTGTDNYANYYRIFINNTAQSSLGSDPVWISGVKETIDIDNLIKGIYNYTIYLFDASNNSQSITVFIDVLDNTKPVMVEQPVNISFPEGSKGYVFTWNSTDLYPGLYYLYINGELNSSASWSNATNITIGLNGRVEGWYNYTIIICDQSNNQLVHQVRLIVTDIPVWDIELDDYIFTEGNSETLYWNASDSFPDNYTIYVDAAFYISGDWNSAEYIDLVLDSFAKGIYNISIVLQDNSSNSIGDWFWLTVIDLTLPNFDSGPNNITIFEGSSNNYLTWNTTDLYPSNYTIYLDFLNGSIIEFDFDKWNNADNISVNIDNFPKGLYNFTLIILDESGNRNNHTVFVDVIDVTDPVIIDSPDEEIHFVENTGILLLNWTASDIHYDYYIIYQNSSQVISNYWEDSQLIQYNISELQEGRYNFTIVIFDTSLNWVNNTIWVTITDIPIWIFTPSEREFIEGQSLTLYWNSTDTYAFNYTIFVNSEVWQTDVWTNAESIKLVLDTFLKGTYNICIVIMDTAFNAIMDQFYLDVYDTTQPIIVGPTSSQVLIEGTTGHSLQWNVTDTYASNFTIYLNYLNGTIQVLQFGDWETKVNISQSIDGYLMGVYNFTLVVEDVSKNRAKHVVIIEYIDTTAPSIVDVPDDIITFVENTGERLLNWRFSDLHPDEYTLYQNGSIVAQNIWSDSIQYNITLLIYGNYNFTIIVLDQSNNQIKLEYMIDVREITAPVLGYSPDNIQIAEFFDPYILQWKASELYPGIYQLFVNDSLMVEDLWNSDVFVNYTISGLGLGTWNITILFNDESFNVLRHSVFIYVFDDIIPGFISSPLSGNQIEGETEILQWQVQDAHAASFEIRINDVLNEQGEWQNLGYISFDPSVLVRGIYNISVLIRDGSNNWNMHSIELEIIDNQSPVFTQTAQDRVISEGTVGIVLAWGIDDLHNQHWILYKNQSIIEQGNNSNPNYIVSYTITEILLKGIIIYTLYIYDDSGNENHIDVTVIIIDTTKPNLSFQPLENIEFSEGDIGIDLEWILFENYPSYYQIILNDENISSGEWMSGEIIQMNIDSLLKGVYNLSIVFYDDSMNSISDEVHITVIDTTVPILVLAPQNQDYLESKNLLSINWTATDNYPGQYEISFNNEIIQDGWQSNSSISLIIGSLLQGEYNISISILDASNNAIHHWFILNVLDDILPELKSAPEVTEFVLTGTSNEISWLFYDNHPNNYFITVDGIERSKGAWSNDIPITFILDSLTARPEKYNITIRILDDSANSLISSVLIKIRHPIKVETLAPSINIVEVVYEGDVEYFTGIWSDVNGTGVANGSILVEFKQGNLILESWPLNTNLQGEFILILNYTDYEPGDYQWHFIFTKENYYGQEDLIPIRINPHNIKLTIEISGDLVQGEAFTITARVTYDNPGTTSLSLDEIVSRTGFVSNIVVKFEINFIRINGENGTSAYSATAIDGFASITLGPEITANIDKITGISASVDDSNFNVITSRLDEKDFPDVVPPDLNFTQIFNNFIQNNAYFIIIGIIIITSIIIANLYLKAEMRKKNAKILKELTDAKAEIDSIKAISMIIIQTTSGLPLFEKRLKNSVTLDSLLISGMSSALTAFLSEFDNNVVEGFEFLERETISLTSHSSDLSKIIVISERKLSNTVLNQIAESHSRLIDEYGNVFTDGDHGFDELSENQIYPIFNKSRFKVDLLKDLTVKPQNIRRIQNIKSLSRMLRQNLDLFRNYPHLYPETTNLQSVETYLRELGLKADMIAMLILVMYHFDGISTE